LRSLVRAPGPLVIDAAKPAHGARPVGPLVWRDERVGWPHADASSFERAGGIRWHIQRMGSGPAVLLVHGTGASLHSWRLIAPLLAARFTVVSVDLPGHGFTEQPKRRALSLPVMADAIAELVETLGIRPLLLVGHSAGAAIVIRSCVDHGLSAEGVISINGALRPFRGAAGFLYPSLAKLMFLNPWTPNIIARSATDRERVERLIHGTGSNIDEPGVDLYARLMTSPVHVASALGMVAHWDLSALDRALPRLAHPLLLVTGQRDRAVPPEDAEYARQLAPRARVSEVSGVGHLAHEEAPETVADLIFDFAGKLAGNPANEGPESAPAACSGDR